MLPTTMEFQSLASLFLITLLFSFSPLVKGLGNTGSVLFIDSTGDNRYLRSSSGLHVQHDDSISSLSSSEVSAVISLLLGYAPPPLAADSYIKIDNILLPKPFDKPSAIMVLEVAGFEDSSLIDDHMKVHMDGVLSSRIVVDDSGPYQSDITDFVISDEDGVFLVEIDKLIDSECNFECIEQELHNLASLLEASYVSSHEQLGGVFTFYPSGIAQDPLNLHVSKVADKRFLMGLVSLMRNTRAGTKLCGDCHGAALAEPRLLSGSFDGIQILEKEYGKDVSKVGTELLSKALMKLFDLLESAYEGRMVAIVMANGNSSSNPGSILNVKYPAQRLRILDEVTASNTTNATSIEAAAAAQLVEGTLAWITGVIFIVSTLGAVYLLLYMPLTRDTLLYSNVKLD